MLFYSTAVAPKWWVAASVWSLLKDGLVFLFKLLSMYFLNASLMCYFLFVKIQLSVYSEIWFDVLSRMLALLRKGSLGQKVEPRVRSLLKQKRSWRLSSR